MLLDYYFHLRVVRTLAITKHNTHLEVISYIVQICGKGKFWLISLDLRVDTKLLRQCLYVKLYVNSSQFSKFANISPAAKTALIYGGKAWLPMVLLHNGIVFGPLCPLLSVARSSG